jgi:hypothetical protein
VAAGSGLELVMALSWGDGVHAASAAANDSKMRTIALSVGLKEARYAK